jgi:alkylhydroperoxidase/carboxymuconolactone decarboxylase family protein
MKEHKHTPYLIAEDLKKFGNVSDDTPELGKQFFDWYGSVFAEGALSAKVKAIMGLSVAISLNCPYCIDAYTNECIKMGYSPAEMSEANHVASALKGGSTLVNGVQMKKIIDKKVMR